MPNKHDNEKAEFIRFFFSLRNDHESWSDYMCLHIAFQDNTIDLSGGADAIFTSYLQHISYKTYQIDNQNIYILFKNKDIDTIAQAVQQIELYCVFEKHTCLTTWYVLDQQSEEFQDHVRKEFLIVSTDLASAVEKYKKAPQEPKTYSGHVLLVEDDPITRWMVRQVLRDNCLLATATCAHQVYSLYQSWQPDLVILDINLPDESGEDILHWIMNRDPAANVVMFSSKDDVDTMITTLENGAKGFIVKPFHRSKILHYLHIYTPFESELNNAG